MQVVRPPLRFVSLLSNSAILLDLTSRGDVVAASRTTPKTLHPVSYAMPKNVASLTLTVKIQRLQHLVGSVAP